MATLVDDEDLLSVEASRSRFGWLLTARSRSRRIAALQPKEIAEKHRGNGDCSSSPIRWVAIREFRSLSEGKMLPLKSMSNFPYLLHRWVSPVSSIQTVGHEEEEERDARSGRGGHRRAFGQTHRNGSSVASMATALGVDDGAPNWCSSGA
ncbi:hypothetical protein ACLOJK_014715 [Asimina triloba]